MTRDNWGPGSYGTADGGEPQGRGCDIDRRDEYISDSGKSMDGPFVDDSNDSCDDIFVIDPRLDDRDIRPKKGAWAPGTYLGECDRCGREYVGDKRARNCAPCAYGDKADLSTLTQVGGREVLAVEETNWCAHCEDSLAVKEIREEGECCAECEGPIARATSIVVKGVGG